jgi:hypothetical protein
MIQTGFHIGNKDWWIMATLDISDREDLRDVYESLLSVGVPDFKAREVCMVLSQPNRGYTLTDYDGKYSLMFISRATSPSQMYDSIDHEKKHVVEHISTYYGVEPKSEEAAYLSGELGRLLFPAAAYVICPHCNQHKH